MRLRFAATLAAVLTLTPIVPAFGETAPQAVLMAREGTVHVIQAGGGSLAGQFGMHLDAGDEIRTGAGSSADVIFSSGDAIHLGANSNLVVRGNRGAGGSTAVAASSNFESVQRYLKLKESRGTSSLAMLRSSSTPAELVPLAPCQTRIREALPVFRWRSGQDAGALKLTVYHEGGVHWAHEVSTGDQLAYPADAPALTPGVRYSWTIETTDPLLFPPLRSRASFFEILGPDEVQALAADLKGALDDELSAAGQDMMRASVLFEHGLLDEAIAATIAALGRNGADESHDLRSILACLYVETGRTTEAMAEYDRLLEPR